MYRHSTLITILLSIFLLTACSSGSSLLEMEEWDLVWISDSSGWGVAEVYAQMVEEDTGIRVNVHDNWIGGLAAGDVLRALQGEPGPSFRLERLGDLIREAEIIVFYANPSQSVDEEKPGDWLCVSAVTDNYVNECGMETFDTYIAHLEAIYAIIFDLRGDQPTIIRAYDAYNPLIAKFIEQGVYEECKACWANYNAAMHQAAATYDIPVAEISLAWNGPEFERDPVAAGYTKDGEHPNEEGARVIAQTIRDLGYDPISP